jgi:hypothetical protein
MTHWKAVEWRAEVDAGSGIRVYRLAGVLTDSRDSFTFVEQVRTELRSDPRLVAEALAAHPKGAWELRP